MAHHACGSRSTRSRSSACVAVCHSVGRVPTPHPGAVVCATVMASLTADRPTADIALLAIRAAEGNAATAS